MSEHTVPAFTEANRRRVDPNACACRVDDGEIIYCALHAAAPALLAALKESTVYLDRLVHSHIEQWPHQLRAALEHGQQAIKEAEGE